MLKYSCWPPSMPSSARVLFNCPFSIGCPNRKREIHAMRQTIVGEKNVCICRPAFFPISAASASHTALAVALVEGTVIFEERCVFTLTHSTYAILADKLLAGQLKKNRCDIQCEQAKGRLHLHIPKHPPECGLREPERGNGETKFYIFWYSLDKPLLGTTFALNFQHNTQAHDTPALASHATCHVARTRPPKPKNSCS